MGAAAPSGSIMRHTDTSVSRYPSVKQGRGRRRRQPSACQELPGLFPCSFLKILGGGHGSPSFTVGKPRLWRFVGWSPSWSRGSQDAHISPTPGPASSVPHAALSRVWPRGPRFYPMSGLLPLPSDGGIKTLLLRRGQ